MHFVSTNQEQKSKPITARLTHVSCTCYVLHAFALSLDCLTETVYSDILFLTIDSYMKISLATMYILVRKGFFSFSCLHRDKQIE